MRLNQEERRAAEAWARTLTVEQGLVEQLAPYAALRVGSDEAAGWMAGPTLQLDDVSPIPFLDGIVGNELYQLRARVRARDGDLYVATCPQVPGYEPYNQERLGLGRPDFVYAEPVATPGQVSAACGAGLAFEALTQHAKRRGRLLVHPYMGAEAIWELAADLAASAQVPMRVLAPPPPITWITNDKAHVSRAAEALVSDGLLGGAPVVDTRIGRDPAALAAALRELSGRHAAVALKMTRCASAMGNHVFRAEAVIRASPAALEAEVLAFLVDKRWTRGDEVLAVAWEETHISPSTQLWIPPLGGGDAHVDGVYEQLLVGPEKVFLGAIPSRLGEQMDRCLSRASLRIAAAFQALGYVGRCSFDFIVTEGDARFVECNGRWGGTSTPMHLLDRLFRGGRPPYRARDFVHPELVGRPLPDLLEALGDELYDVRTDRGRFIVYNVGCLQTYGKLDVICLAPTAREASRGLEEDLPRLWGL